MLEEHHKYYLVATFEVFKTEDEQKDEKKILNSRCKWALQLENIVARRQDPGTGEVE